MSDTFVISKQWTCLTEPERSIALEFEATILTPFPYAFKAVVDAQFELERGADWEIFRDMWFANWAIILVTIPVDLVDVDVYTTIEPWPVGVQGCLIAGECGAVTTRCRAVTGF
jgi:hypothetical protein